VTHIADRFVVVLDANAPRIRATYVSIVLDVLVYSLTPSRSLHGVAAASATKRDGDTFDQMTGGFYSLLCFLQ
jgi:hypothetical protein